MKGELINFYTCVPCETVSAKTRTALKRKASIAANKRNCVHDEMLVTLDDGKTLRLYRTNVKTPWGTITRGRWK